jgi:hypothetical protein
LIWFEKHSSLLFSLDKPILSHKIYALHIGIDIFMQMLGPSAPAQRKPAAPSAAPAKQATPLVALNKPKAPPSAAASSTPSMSSGQARKRTLPSGFTSMRCLES